MPPDPLTTRELAELTNQSTRSVQRHIPDRAVHALPADLQRAWAAKDKVVELIPTPATPGQLALALTVPQGPNLTVEDRAQAEARYAVIEPLIAPERAQQWWLLAQGRKTDLIDLLAKEHKTAPRSIHRWLHAFRTGGLPALVTKDRSDKGQPRVLTPAALDFLVKAAFPHKGAYGRLTIAEIYRAYNEERIWRAAHVAHRMGDFEQHKYARYLDDQARLSSSVLLPAACYKTFCNWFDRIPDVAKVLARDGLEAFSNTQEVISWRNLVNVQPLDYVVMDHRRLDLFCLIPERAGWKLARPWLTAALDMRTRKWLAWVLVATPSSDSIATVLKRTFIAHGLPKALYWDNGKDFCSEWLEGRAHKAGPSYRIPELDTATRGVLETLGVRVHHAIVRRARSKIIEANFGATADYDQSTPWWCGHKPDARPESFAALIAEHERWLKGELPESPFPTIHKLAGLYDEFIHTLNEREHTSGEGMAKITPAGRAWMSPNEAWEKLIPNVERKVVPDEVIHFCFNKRRQATIHHGEIRAVFSGRPYHYRFADNAARMMLLNGREVEFGYDPHDLETIAVYHDGNFEGLAHNIELRKMGEQDFVADEKLRRSARREVRRAIDAIHRSVYVPSIEERAARRAAVRPAPIEPNRPEIPAPIPPALLAAAKAQRIESAFRFSAAPSDAGVIPQPDDDPNDNPEFRFFQGGPCQNPKSE